VVDRHGAALRRAAEPAPGPAPGHLRFAVTVASPSAKVAPRWGDWHLANDLGQALRRLGHDVVVSTADGADRPTVRGADVHVVLRGIAPVRRSPGQRHVLWVISHPDRVTDAECDDADLVLVASPRFARALAARTSTPVEVLLQATDIERFHPGPVDPAAAHPVLVVAKTRDVLRPMVADAVAAGLRPAIVGTGWHAFGLDHLVVRDHVPNEDLPILYRSAGVVLNDHWDAMREWGFVSNRLFDVLACGTPVISDELAEVAELFGDAVLTYRSPDELATLVAAVLADPVAARERAERGRVVVHEAHTFDHRAAALVEALARHDLDRPPG
ncbi:MAG: hypothetical protein JWM05_1954, partial [Acidimicrobiales bacterium]|nr:hypothetical protein [Acidimicrobiales bacterium]